MNFKKKSKTLIIVLVIVSISIPSTIISAIALNNDNNHQNVASQTDEERTIAAQISNITGESIEEILEMKNNGITWNEILELLEIEDVSIDEVKQREDILLQTGLNEELIQNLISHGYSEEDIMDAKMLIERVMSQLQDIVTESTVINTSINNFEINKNDEINNFNNLYKKIDVEKAITLMLALKEDFGTIEKVLDEYLYTLQIGIDLDNYLINKEEYTEVRNLKSIEINITNIITIAKIEEKILEIIQSKNANIVEEENIMLNQLLDNEVKTPSTPLPNNNPQPQDPLEDVMKEIEEITNNSLYPTN